MTASLAIRFLNRSGTAPVTFTLAGRRAARKVVLVVRRRTGRILSTLQEIMT
jgi:hypothetical protein